MKKMIRITGLLVFWVSTFALVTLLVRWRQQLPLPEQETEQGEGGGIQTASLGPGGGPGKPGEASENRSEVIAVGRSLFDVPEPFSVAEISDFLNDLRDRSLELDQRSAALDLRSKELEVLEYELESRRSEILALAQELSSQVPVDEATQNLPDSASMTSEAYKKIANVYASIKDKGLTSRALLARPTEEAAQILLQMDEKDAAAVLAQFPEEALQEVTRAMLVSHGNKDE
jgi:flagellar motility protein MotE (MotC chaperone)